MCPCQSATALDFLVTEFQEGRAKTFAQLLGVRKVCTKLTDILLSPNRPMQSDTSKSGAVEKALRTDSCCVNSQSIYIISAQAAEQNWHGRTVLLVKSGRVWSGIGQCSDANIGSAVLCNSRAPQDWHLLRCPRLHRNPEKACNSF